MIKIIQHFKRKPKLKNPVLIFGMGGGMGAIAKVAGEYILENKKSRKLYTFYGDIFPHSVYVNNEGELEIFKAELYLLNQGKKKKRDILILTGETQPINERGQYEFAELILDIFQDLGGELIITVGGYDIGYEPEDPKIYISGSHKELIEEYREKLGLKNEFSETIAGLAGLLIGLGKMRGLKGVVFLAETFGHPLFIGLRGVRAVLKVLNQLLDLNIDLKKLEKQIEEREEIEKRLLSKTKKISKKPGKDISYIG